MVLKPEAMDEIGGTSRPLLEIPLALAERVARMYIGRMQAAIVIFGTGVALAVVTLCVEIKPKRSPFNVPAPPERLCYRVPEPYRPAVEDAIRALGKSVDRCLVKLSIVSVQRSQVPGIATISPA